MTNRERDEPGDEAGHAAEEPGLEDGDALAETDRPEAERPILDEEGADEAALAPPVPAGRPPGTQAGPATAEPVARVRDRVSAWFVIASIAAFVLILLNGLLFGRGGALSPTPTPEPSPSISASPSTSPVGSASPPASPSGATSPSASPPGPASPSPVSPSAGPASPSSGTSPSPS